MDVAKNFYSLDKKTILVTGSSRGIGAATARLAKEYGANVILHGKTDSEHLRKLSSELSSEYIFCDVGNEEEVREKVGGLEVDVLVNNAGINPSKTFENLSLDDWKNIFDTNLYGPVNFSKSVIPYMTKIGSGKIINVSSMKGLSHVVAKPAYAASKAAINRMTSSMAEEYAPKILINAVAPGFVDTDLVEQTLSEKIQGQINKIPLQRMASPREIAEVILFLASDKSNYITGQTITVDGGLSVISGQ